MEKYSCLFPPPRIPSVALFDKFLWFCFRLLPSKTEFAEDGTNAFNISVLRYNWRETAPEGGFASALYFGFAAALLGISGFESSANYVEQQQDGVFPKVCVGALLLATPLLRVGPLLLGSLAL